MNRFARWLLPVLSIVVTSSRCRADDLVSSQLVQFVFRGATASITFEKYVNPDLGGFTYTTQTLGDDFNSLLLPGEFVSPSIEGSFLQLPLFGEDGVAFGEADFNTGPDGQWAFTSGTDGLFGPVVPEPVTGGAVFGLATFLAPISTSLLGGFVAYLPTVIELIVVALGIWGVFLLGNKLLRVPVYAAGDGLPPKLPGTKKWGVEVGKLVERKRSRVAGRRSADNGGLTETWL